MADLGGRRSSGLVDLEAIKKARICITRPKVTDGLANLFTPGGSAARESAQEAKTIVSDVVNQTTFVPDLSTDRDKYVEDQKTCK
jgi:hypothetical protein